MSLEKTEKRLYQKKKKASWCQGCTITIHNTTPQTKLKRYILDGLKYCDNREIHSKIKEQKIEYAQKIQCLTCHHKN